jgi:hypothetical protein
MLESNLSVLSGLMNGAEREASRLYLSKCLVCEEAPFIQQAECEKLNQCQRIMVATCTPMELTG